MADEAQFAAQLRLDPRQRDAAAVKVSETAGTLTGIIAAGGAAGEGAKIVGATAKGITAARVGTMAVQGGLANTRQQYDAARQSGLSHREALKTVVPSLAVGVAGSLPLGGKVAGSALYRVIAEAGQNSAQGLATQVANNAIVRQTYDPGRDLLEGATEGLVLDAALGSIGMLPHDPRAILRSGVERPGGDPIVLGMHEGGETNASKPAPEPAPSSPKGSGGAAPRIDSVTGKDYEKYISESESTSPAHLADQSRTFREAAARAHSGGGAGAGSATQGKGGGRALSDWAVESQRLVSQEALSALPVFSDNTSEHIVHYRAGDQRVVKETREYYYGEIPVVEGDRLVSRNATSAEYLERMTLQIAVFHSDFRLEGIAISKELVLLDDPRQAPRIVVSQPWYRSVGDATQEKIDAYLSEAGFQKVPGSFYGWVRVADGVVIQDATPDNFILTNAGLVPIDLQMNLLTEVELAQLKLGVAGDEKPEGGDFIKSARNSPDTDDSSTSFKEAGRQSQGGGGFKGHKKFLDSSSKLPGAIAFDKEWQRIEGRFRDLGVEVDLEADVPRSETDYQNPDRIIVRIPAKTIQRRESTLILKDVSPGKASRMVLGEELIHAAHVIALRKRWRESGLDKELDFESFVHADHLRILNDMRETIESAPARERQSLLRTVQDCYDIYYREGSSDRDAVPSGQIFAAMEAAGPERMVDFVAEFLRMTTQLRKQGDIHESTSAKLRARIAAWLREAVFQIRRALPGAYEGKFGAEVKARLEEIDKRLADWPG